ncbi:MAG: deoxyribodipyrimidine photolyase [Sulfuricurvum sp. PC08-66]|nr:MAG: deoxyribodipyrimidine photolyase [Sulfuricurvum sp. PC08-66]
MRTILWFRRDLRIEDNALLAIEGEVLPLFIFDSTILESLPREDRRVGFIIEAVSKLREVLRARGLDLLIFHGEPTEIFAVLKEEGFDEVWAAPDWDSYARTRDAAVGAILKLQWVNNNYLFTPAQLLKADGTPYVVFKAYYTKAKALWTPELGRTFTPARQTLALLRHEIPHRIQSDAIAKAIGFAPQPHGVASIETLLEAFDIASYASMRDRIDEEVTSGLSVHLRFGTLGIRTLVAWMVAQKKRGIETEPFFRQLLFREFYAYLLYHLPHVATRNFRYDVAGIPDERRYSAFCQGRTGVPLVDAGIHELLETGRMHNRVRMVVASFFTKHLLLPWQWGEAFFARYLLDYDAASNILSWQWSASTGVDAQPYFRIFNPYTQARAYDPDAHYIKEWLPQLAHLPPKELHDEHFLLSHAIEDYPKPIVEHAKARMEALAQFGYDKSQQRREDET